MHEAAGERWSIRQLAHQIFVLYYERLFASLRKAPARKEAGEKLAAFGPDIHHGIESADDRSPVNGLSCPLQHEVSQP